MNILEFTVRLLVALLLGACVGIERQWRQKSAGLRTNTLVSLGSAAFILLSVSIGGDAVGRVASYVVSGIGFLGAGVIMKDGMTVQGLNTAATIWCSAAVGTFSGLGLWKQASVTTAFVILTHLVLRPLGNLLGKAPSLKPDDHETEYLFTIHCKQEIENHIRGLLMQMLGNDEKLLLRSLTSNDNVDPAYAHIVAEIFTDSRLDNVIEKVASRLTIERDVIKVKWEVIGQKNDL